jgi:DNA invertase Pin-like site-specific DNA recombinase
MMKAAIYARVSTFDQNVSMQLNDLRRLAKQRGFELWKEYIDEGQSGGKTSRPSLDAMLADARRGRFQVLLVWKLDRLGRSTSHLISLLEDFKTWNVQLVSFGEGLDFTTTAGKLFYTLLGAFAEFEKDTIRERVRAGLRNAKARGVQLGRPALRKFTAADIRLLRRDRRKGMPFAQLAQRHGTSVWTAFQICQRRLKSAVN